MTLAQEVEVVPIVQHHAEIQKDHDVRMLHAVIRVDQEPKVVHSALAQQEELIRDRLTAHAVIPVQREDLIVRLMAHALIVQHLELVHDQVFDLKEVRMADLQDVQRFGRIQRELHVVHRVIHAGHARALN